MKRGEEHCVTLYPSLCVCERVCARSNACPNGTVTCPAKVQWHRSFMYVCMYVCMHAYNFIWLCIHAHIHAGMSCCARARGERHIKSQRGVNGSKKWRGSAHEVCECLCVCFVYMSLSVCCVCVYVCTYLCLPQTGCDPQTDCDPQTLRKMDILWCPSWEFMFERAQSPLLGMKVLGYFRFLKLTKHPLQSCLQLFLISHST